MLRAAHGNFQLGVKGIARFGAGQKVDLGDPLVQKQQQAVQLQNGGAAVTGPQGHGGGGQAHRPHHRAAGFQRLHGVIDALPGQASDRAVHGKARTLLPGAHRAGGGRAKRSVHRDGRQLAVVGGQPPQIELHSPHSRTAAALAHRGGELPGRYVVIHNFVGDREGDLL